MACQPYETATTDNTPLECNEFLSDTCVIRAAAIEYLELPANSTQNQVTTALVASLENARNRIAVLEGIVEDFETRIAALEA